MRINARLDEEQTRKLNFLKEATHASVSEVIKHAVDQYYADFRKTEIQARDVLRHTGFIGCAEGQPDLADTYKSKLDGVLTSKHDYR